MTLGEDPGGPRDEGFAVAPQQLGWGPGGGGRRGDRIRAGLVIGCAVGLVVVAIAGAFFDPRSSQVRPTGPVAEASTDTNASRFDRRPLATAMPQLVVEDPTRPPSGRVLTFTDAYRWLDLSSGTFGDAVPMSLPVVSLPDGSFLCACIESPWSSANQVTTLRVERFAADGRRLGAPRSVSFEGIRSGAPSSNVVSVGRAFAADGGTVFAGAAARVDGGAWRFGLVALPVMSGQETRMVLGEVGGEPAIRYVGPPLVGVSHDGRHIMVAATIQRGTIRNPAPIERARWLATFDGSRFTAATSFPLPTSAGGTDRCVAEGFVDSDVYADVCMAPEPDTAALVPTVRRFGLDGRLLSAVTLSPRPLISANILLDRLSRSIYAWDPDGHILYRVDGRDGSLSSAAVPAGVLAAAGGSNPPDRHFLLNSTQTFVLSPDGSRLYAIGATGGAIDRAPGSTGIWVFDARTLDWLEHWEPATNYAALSISDDGGRLFAAGLAGVTAEGRPSAAEASVTVHDASDGSVEVVAGRLGWNFTIGFAEG